MAKLSPSRIGVFHERFLLIKIGFGVKLSKIMANQNLPTVACIALQYEIFRILSVWRLQGEWYAAYCEATRLENSVEKN